jgi:tRNA-2-methylthio-N6-dimethylallyladenosine synthase
MSDDSTRKVFVQTHGCQMNEYDSARMLDLLRESNGCSRPKSPRRQTSCC